LATEELEQLLEQPEGQSTTTSRPTRSGFASVENQRIKIPKKIKGEKMPTTIVSL
jgi:hypothetical protein